jgi:hypothetical protein
MDTHVKVLGILNIVGGVLGICGALVMILVFGGVAGIIAVDGDADAGIAIPIIGLTGSALVAGILLFSIPAIVVGWALYRFRPWARIAGIVLSIVSLMWVPFGTLLGVYGLWVLLRKDSERLFLQQPAGTA